MGILQELFSHGINRDGKIVDFLIESENNDKPAAPAANRDAGERKAVNRSSVSRFSITADDLQFSCGDPEKDSGESSESSEHKFSSTQFNIDDAGYPRSQGSPLDTLRKMAKAIPDKDLAEDGREDEFHVTVLWGLE